MDFLKLFFSFDRMIAVSVIKILYWIGLVGGTIGGVVSALASLFAIRYSFLGGLGGFVGVLIGTAFGLLMWRVACEGMIVMFGIHERLGEIRDRMPSKA